MVHGMYMLNPWDDAEQQLRDLKRLVAYLVLRDGRRRVRIPESVFSQIPDTGEIAVWREPLSFMLSVEIRGVPDIDGLEVVDAEVVDEPLERAALTTAAADPELDAPLTFHNEPHPELPGIVVPVLDQPVRTDPETGAVAWGN